MPFDVGLLRHSALEHFLWNFSKGVLQTPHNRWPELLLFGVFGVFDVLDVLDVVGGVFRVRQVRMCTVSPLLVSNFLEQLSQLLGFCLHSVSR